MADNQTVKRRRLGNELRRLREEAGHSREVVAEHMEWSNAKVWRIEAGKVGVRVRDVSELCVLYNALDAELVATLKKLALEARTTEKSWWHQYGDVLPDWFQIYVNLEDGASEIRGYESELVPGLCQTPDYAEAVHRASQPDSTGEEIRRLVDLRMARQAILERPRSEAPRVWLILNEAVLRRRVGNAEIMRAQLARLREIAAMPGITIQVQTFAAGAHASMLNGFYMLNFKDPETRPIVYIEGATSALYLEKAAEIDTYTVAFEHLQTSATKLVALEGLIDNILKEF
ncbi:helix-turn-helix transcriptional regulator [Streptomyces sp. SID3343]|uniref:Scr1 family TA system antitoxin-like transcriptional regulator n=1 Tax=Streptomyces sp. SID3343 TaxID=2690260 RepID=UPI0019286DAB